MEATRSMRGSVVFCAVLLGALFLMSVLPVPAQAKKEPAWQRQAEENFYLPPGTAGQLMTKHEWEQHWKAMENLGPRHQSQYRREWHVKMMQRAQQRGVRMPGMGGYHGGKGMGQGGGQGMGMGQGGSQGMGSGQGMGQGGSQGMGSGQGMGQGGGQSGSGSQVQGTGKTGQ